MSDVNDLAWRQVTDLAELLRATQAERDALRARLEVLERVWERAKRWRAKRASCDCELCVEARIELRDAIDAALAAEVRP